MSEKPLISFDYAIKYLLKNKGDYDIIEGFISALLATEGYPPVKINALLESESNKESRNLKKSIADLVVEDEKGNKYIVEIERSYTTHFMHKACFNSSRLIIDSISGNQDYTTIKKVFHISLLYFSVPQMNKPIYHGQTIFHEVDTKHPVNVRIANQGLVMFDSPNIFPDYFFIFVPLFNDIISQEMDEWLYVMKHSDVHTDFHSQYMKKVAERLSVLKMDLEERDAYYKYLKEAIHAQDTLMAAEVKGREEGREEGRSEGEKSGLEKGRSEGEKLGLQKMIQKMLTKGKSLKEVADLLDLSIEDIENLRKEQLN